MICLYIVWNEEAINRLKQDGVLAEATITDRQKEPGGRSTQYYLTYTYTANDDEWQTYTIRSNVDWETFNQYRIGSSIIIWYRQDDPSQVLVQGRQHKFGLGWVALIICLISSGEILIGPYFKWRRSRQEASWTPLVPRAPSYDWQPPGPQPQAAHATDGERAEHETIPLRAPRKCGCGLCPDDVGPSHPLYREDQQ